jgi:hypothetical protein
MKTYHKTSPRRQSIENPETLIPANKRVSLAVRLRVLQMQLRHGRNVEESDLTRLLPYCSGSRGGEAQP